MEVSDSGWVQECRRGASVRASPPRPCRSSRRRWVCHECARFCAQRSPPCGGRARPAPQTTQDDVAFATLGHELFVSPWSLYRPKQGVIGIIHRRPQRFSEQRPADGGEGRSPGAAVRFRWAAHRMCRWQANARRSSAFPGTRIRRFCAGRPRRRRSCARRSSHRRPICGPSPESISARPGCLATPATSAFPIQLTRWRR